jgi:carboxypeptidase PM20D1
VWSLLEDALGPELAADVDFVPGLETPASSSPRDTPLWDAMERAAQGFYAGSSLVPMLMTGATDSRHFRRHLDAVCYGFGLFSRRISIDQLAGMAHGDDERVDIESLTMMTDMWEVLARDVCGA